MAEQDREFDIVDQAFEELRSSPLPEGPTPEALERALQAVDEARAEPISIPLFERIRNMNPFAKYPIAASLLIAIIGSIYLFAPSQAKADAAFEKGRAQIQQAKTMTADFTLGERGTPKPTFHGKFFGKVPGKVRIEITVEMEQMLPKDKNLKLPPGMPAQMTTVNHFDFSKQDNDAGQASAETGDAAPDYSADILNDLHKAFDGSRENLGAKQIENVEAQGYRCQIKSKAGSEQAIDIWIDPSSGKPLLVEYDLGHDVKQTMSHITLNQPLDDSLFSAEKPKPGRL